MSDPSTLFRWSLVAVILYLILSKSGAFAAGIRVVGGIVTDAIRTVQGRNAA